MSIDAYFCFCCLSTNDLMNLFSEKPDANYAAILMDLFTIKPIQEEYEYDSYICNECAKCLTDAWKFKRQVLDTLNALQVNGSIWVFNHLPSEIKMLNGSKFKHCLKKWLLNQVFYDMNEFFSINN